MKKTGLKKSAPLILVITALISLTLPGSTVHAAETATVSIIPENNIFSTDITPVNSTFAVNATLVNVTNLFNWQVKILFNASILQCVSASIPSDSPFNFPVQPTPVIDNTTGYVMFGASSLAGQPGVNGSGTLGVVTFKIVKAPSTPGESLNCNLTLDTEDTYLRDPSRHEIPVTLEDGYYEYTWPPVNTLTHEIVVDSQVYVVVTESNCSLGPVPMKFNLTEKSLYFNVSGNTGETGYVNVTIPTDLMWGEFNVTLNGEQLTIQTSTNETHTFLYFTFDLTGADQPVTINAENVIPEFPSTMIMLLLLMTTLLLATATVSASRKRTGINV